VKDNSPILLEVARQCNPIIEKYNKDQNVGINIDKNKSDATVATTTASIMIQKPVATKLIAQVPIPDIYQYYPRLDDKYFKEKLANLYEFYLHKIPSNAIIKNIKDFEEVSLKMCGDFEKTYYQYFVSHYISVRTPYKSLLLYHGVGVGKTCSAITIAEGLLISHSLYEEPKIWVIMPQALKNSFREQIFNMNNMDDFTQLANQCTGELYIRLTHLLKAQKDKNIQKIKKIIKSRYRIFTYDSFATFIENEYKNTDKIVTDKVIIVDEAHNIRASSNTDKAEKRVYTSLVDILKKGINNRLILLTATPLYNEPEDILDLLYLLTINDKRDLLKNYLDIKLFNDKNKLISKSGELISKLASNYISYLRGKNPFTFAVKLSPKFNPNIKMLVKEYKRDSNNKVIPEAYNNWLKKIEDGIVTSELSINQTKYIDKKIDLDEKIYAKANMELVATPRYHYEYYHLHQ